ncbi:MAG TPA: hypothetical protein VI731_01735 [Bacteroidia bacterium]|nr:hypothetical protein [Bacteroidia bacterium]
MKKYKLLIVVLLFSGSLFCRDTLFPVQKRKYVNISFNLTSPFNLFALEANVIVAPLNYIHLGYGRRNYDNGGGGDIFHRPKFESLSQFAEIRFHVPVLSTFTGIFGGVYFDYKKGKASYYDSDYPYWRESNYKYTREVFGLMGGMSIVPLKSKILYLEGFAGTGKVFKIDVTQLPGDPNTEDHTEDIKRREQFVYRIGICIGFAF